MIQSWLYTPATATPVQVFVGAAGTGGAAHNIARFVEFDTLSVEDAGNQAEDSITFEVVDVDVAISAIVPEGLIIVRQDSQDIARGLIKNVEPVWEAIGRRYRVSCTGVSSLLDTCIIPPQGGDAYVRKRGESDKARIAWLLSTFGQPFVKAGSRDMSKVQVLDPRMPQQDFANMTLRQGIEQVLGHASRSANYYVDAYGRLHTWDDDNPESDAAPWKINAAHTLAADEVAPTDLRVDRDTSELVNFYYVRGKTKAGSGVFSDKASIATYGRRQAFIDAPDSNTPRKARRVGRAALSDTKDPIVRTRFRLGAGYAVNGTTLWTAGQKVTITSSAHSLSATEQHVARVTTEYLNSLGDRDVTIEAGAQWHGGNFGGGGGLAGGGGPGGPGPHYPDPTAEVGRTKSGPQTVNPGPCICKKADMTYYLVDDFERPNGTDVGQTLGDAVTGAPWPGGNVWTTFIPTPPDDYGIDTGRLFAEATASTDKRMNNIVQDSTVQVDAGSGTVGDLITERPFAPWSEPWVSLWKIRSDKISTTGSGQPSISFSWFHLDIQGEASEDVIFSDTILYVRFDSAFATQVFVDNHSGDVVSGGGETAGVAKTLVANTWYWLHTDYRNARIRVKLWADGDDEPPTYDIDIPQFYFDNVDFGTTTKENRVALTVSPNDGVGTSRIEAEEWQALVKAEEGSHVTETLLGDGTTTTFTLGQDYLEVLQVSAEGGVISNIVEVSPRSITFDRAPAKGGLISVTYIAA